MQIKASKMKAGCPVIALTTGDPAGIGPEITARLFAGFKPARSAAFIIGSSEILIPWAQRFGWRCPIVGSEEAVSLCRNMRVGEVRIVDTGCRGPIPAGKASRAGGIHAGRAIDLACHLARKRLAQAIVTAPISKESLNLAGYPFPGHTEMLSDYFDSPRCQMMMVYRRFRVVPLTRHLPLSMVPEQLSEDRIVTCLEVVDQALREYFGVPAPRIAVASLNPHAGEEGLLGPEEITKIQPALRRASEMGIQAEGPFASDSLFQSAAKGRYDAYISMYHDQGLIPFKMVAKKRGINVTIGLPVIRTSVDHGTAFDIAGKGEADVSSLEAAYRLAERIAVRRPSKVF